MPCILDGPAISFSVRDTQCERALLDQSLDSQQYEGQASMTHGNLPWALLLCLDVNILLMSHVGTRALLYKNLASLSELSALPFWRPSILFDL